MRLGRAIRTARYRLVEWKPWEGGSSDVEYELYDYQEDPLEARNLAAERPELVRQLAAKFAEHPPAAARK